MNNLRNFKSQLYHYSRKRVRSKLMIAISKFNNDGNKTRTRGIKVGAERQNEGRLQNTINNRNGTMAES